jgi:hypothetical protein
MPLDLGFFLQCLILLIHDRSDKHLQMVSELVRFYESTNKDKQESTSSVTVVIRIIGEVISGTLDAASETQVNLLLTRLKSDSIMKKDKDSLVLIEDAFRMRKMMTSDDLHSTSERVQTTLIWYKASSSLRRMFAALNSAAGSDSIRAMGDIRNIAEQASSLNTICTLSDVDSRPIELEVINFTNIDSLKSGLKKYKARNTDGILKTGLQGLNRMFGKSGGIVRGESVMFNALPHMYKSGTLCSIGMWIPMHNTPPESSTNGKPMIYMPTLENEAYQNMIWIFKQQYITIVGKSPENLSDDEIAEWIYDLFSSKGYTLVVERCLPQEFGYEELVAKVNYYKNMGYDIHAVIIDYMNIMRMGSRDKNASGAGRHLQVRELVSKTCNFMKINGIALISAHPLTRYAQEIASAHKNAVRKFSFNHLADSVDVEREVDVSIYQHLEFNDEQVRFLTWHMTKHRYVDDTPDAHKYCAYPFTPFGILSDIGKAPGYTRDIFTFAFDEHSGEITKHHQPHSAAIF